jgi:DNA-binding GntR family transcriptional regulator
MNAAPVPRTAHSYAYETLRDQILSGVLPPGTPLIQSNLAAELSISMTPVREALRDLTSEGLVTQSPHRGAVVTQLDVADAIEINEIRLKLEPEAVARAALEMTDDDFARCEEIFVRLGKATAGEWVALNREFHMQLFRATPSRRLRSVLDSLAGFAALYVGMAVAHRQGEAPQTEHRGILDAMKRLDTEAVIDQVSRHIQHSLDSLHRAAEDEALAGHGR